MLKTQTFLNIKMVIKVVKKRELAFHFFASKFFVFFHFIFSKILY